MRRLSRLLPALGLLMLLAGGWDSSAAPAGARTHTVVIEGMKFSPALLAVRPGDTVVFRNNDIVPHNVTERSSRAFDSGMINRQESWQLVAKEEGTLNYQCIYHPDMKGTISVTLAETKPAAPARTAAIELCGSR